MRRLVPATAALLLLAGGMPIHAQQTDADTTAADTARTTMETDTMTTVEGPDTTGADTARAARTALTDSMATDSMTAARADSLTADSAGARADSVAVPSPEERAQMAAESWLSLIDASDFGAGWDAAAPSLREGRTREEWITQGVEARRRLDTLQTRRLRSTQYRDSTAQLPGEGPVAILQYTSQFEGGATLEAVITTRRDSAWSVAGYRMVLAPDSVSVADSTQEALGESGGPDASSESP